MRSWTPARLAGRNGRALSHTSSGVPAGRQGPGPSRSPATCLGRRLESACRPSPSPCRGAAARVRTARRGGGDSAWGLLLAGWPRPMGVTAPYPGIGPGGPPATLTRALPPERIAALRENRCAALRAPVPARFPRSPWSPWSSCGTRENPGTGTPSQRLWPSPAPPPAPLLPTPGCLRLLPGGTLEPSPGRLWNRAFPPSATPGLTCLPGLFASVARVLPPPSSAPPCCSPPATPAEEVAATRWAGKASG